MKNTFFIATHPGPLSTLPENVKAMSWTPWEGCKDREEALGLASHRFLRNRGGVLRGESFRFSVLIRMAINDTPEAHIVRTYEMEARRP